MTTDKQTGKTFSPVQPILPAAVRTDSESATVWTAFCRELERAGHTVLSQPDVDDPMMAAETLRFAIRELRAGLDWYTECAPYDTPRFIRADDSGSGPPGPNLDNTNYYAHLRAGREYLVRIDTATVYDIIIGVSNADYRNYGDYSLADFDVGDDGFLEITIAAEQRSGNWLALLDDAYRLGLRVYFRDWESDVPPELTIERIDSTEPPVVPSVNELGEGLTATAEYLRTWPFKYPIFQTLYADQIEANEMRAPVPIPGGGQEIQYGLARYRIADDQALIVETDVPDAPYWGFHLYTMPWFSQIDVGNRVTALNCLQTHVDGDGRARYVVAHRDPGVQNWLDTGGFATGSVFYRWVWSENSPVPTSRVVPLQQVRDALPDDTPTFTAADRRAQLAVRRRHLQRRSRA